MEVNIIYNGDAIIELKKINENSNQCVVTPLPYWNLRDYNHPLQLRLENTPEEYINKLIKIFEEIKRVLKKDGKIWLNLGDTYFHIRKKDKVKQSINNESSGHPIHIKKHPYLKNKDLCGVPFRVAFRLQEQLRLYLRQTIIWHKPNAIPPSVTDRTTTDYEFIFLLSKSNRYYYNYKLIQEKNQDKWGRWSKYSNPKMKKCGIGSMSHAKERTKQEMEYLGTKGRNCRSVWLINTVSYPEAHFSVFPREIPRRCILAGSKEGDIILDPFCDSGTTLEVAKHLRRKYIGIEIVPEYIKLCNRRLSQSILEEDIFNDTNN